MTRKQVVEKLIQNELINYKRSSAKTKENMFHFLLINYYNSMTDLQISNLFEKLYYK